MEVVIDLQFKVHGKENTIPDAQLRTVMGKLWPAGQMWPA